MDTIDIYLFPDWQLRYREKGRRGVKGSKVGAELCMTWLIYNIGEVGPRNFKEEACAFIDLPPGRAL